MPRSVGNGSRLERGAAACRTIGGLRVDRAVAAAVLDAIHPAGVAAALAALDRGLSAHNTQRQALALAWEKARDEAQRARRH